MLSFIENNKVVRCSNAAAAAQTDVEATAVDMSGFQSVTFMVPFGTITAGAVTSIKAQQSDDNGSTDGWSDLEGTSVSVADDDDNGVALLEISKPSKRYVRCVVDRGTQNAVVDGVFAILSNPLSGPVTQHTTVIGAELHETPAEGTA